jgi:hypothetical protein
MNKNIEVKQNTQGITHLQVCTWYEIGSTEAWQSKERGYYASVNPVTIESKGAYSITTGEPGKGVNSFILSVKRQSKKAEKECDTLLENRLQDMIEYVCNKNNLEVK